MYLWRAVEAEGEILELLVQRRRDAKAAKKLMRKLLKRQGVSPTAIITDKFPSYSPTTAACHQNTCKSGGVHT